MAKTYTTRVRVAEEGEIVKLSKGEFDRLLNTNTRKGGSGISQLVRSMRKGEALFVLCEEQKKGHSHLYKAAEATGIEIAIRRGQKDGNDGYWVLCTG
jgi:hypothetical protein